MESLARFEDVRSCSQVDDAIATRAVASGESLRAFVEHAARIANLEDGAPKILMVLARIVRDRVDWFDGDLVIEVRSAEDDDTATVLDVFSEQGWNIRERIVPRTRLAVPADEFQRAVVLAPTMIAPLHVSHGVRSMVLSANEPKPSAGPPELELEPEVSPNERETAPPAPGAHSMEPVGSDGAADTAEVADADAGEEEEARSVHNRPTIPRMIAIRPEAMPSTIMRVPSTDVPPDEGT